MLITKTNLNSNPQYSPFCDTYKIVMVFANAVFFGWAVKGHHKIATIMDNSWWEIFLFFLLYCCLRFSNVEPGTFEHDMIFISYKKKLSVIGICKVVGILVDMVC